MERDRGKYVILTNEDREVDPVELNKKSWIVATVFAMLCLVSVIIGLATFSWATISIGAYVVSIFLDCFFF